MYAFAPTILAAAEYDSEWCELCDDHPNDPGGGLHLGEQCILSDLPASF